MSEELPDDDKRPAPSVSTDLARSSVRTTQRGATPPLGVERPTSTATPAQSDMVRATPVPESLERFIQKLIGAASLTGAPHDFVRSVLVEGVRAKVVNILDATTKQTASKHQREVAARLLRVLAEEA